MGSVVFSVDAELGWGFHHHDEPPTDRVYEARAAWRRLLDLLDEHRVPATWAVVGHLLLDGCDAAHPGHPAGERCCETAGDAAADVWFGGDLVDAVRDADARHEIASHGFTHVHFRHDRMTRAFADAELRESLAAAADCGVEPSSFVFPVNEIDHRDLLAEHGFDCYRGAKPTNGRSAARLRKLAGAAVDRGTPPVVEPSVDEYGLVNVPASLYLFCIDDPVRSVVSRVHGDPVVAQVERGLDRALDEGGVLHLWLHPHNLTADWARERLRDVLAAVDRRRDDGLRVETMRDAATRTRTGEVA